MKSMNLFMRPVVWGIGPGPQRLQSIDEAISAIEMWLAVIPDAPQHRSTRDRMLTVLDMLLHVQNEPIEADLVSAKIALKGLARSARTVEQRHRAAGRPPRVFEHVTH